MFDYYEYSLSHHNERVSQMKRYSPIRSSESVIVKNITHDCGHQILCDKREAEKNEIL